MTGRLSEQFKKFIEDLPEGFTAERIPNPKKNGYKVNIFLVDVPNTPIRTFHNNVSYDVMLKNVKEINEEKIEDFKHFTVQPPKDFTLQVEEQVDEIKEHAEEITAEASGSGVTQKDIVIAIDSEKDEIVEKVNEKFKGKGKKKLVSKDTVSEVTAEVVSEAVGDKKHLTENQKQILKEAIIHEPVPKQAPTQAPASSPVQVPAPEPVTTRSEFHPIFGNMARWGHSAETRRIYDSRSEELLDEVVGILKPRARTDFNVFRPKPTMFYNEVFNKIKYPLSPYKTTKCTCFAPSN